MNSSTRSRRGCHSAVVALATIVLAALGANARAQTTLFFDDFNGPTLNPVFQASLPNGPLGSGGGNLTYLGAPNYSFGTLDGASVLRLTNTLNSRQRVGWNTNATFNASDFRLEVRFNSLVQSPTTSIDSFIEAWLIDNGNPSRFGFAGPHGQNFGTLRQFRGGSSIDGQYVTQAFNFTDNTWYRLVLTGGSSQNIRASIFADDGTTELIGQTFGFNASAFPSGFELGLSQATGVPGAPYPVDVAIDYVRLTTGAVPEPASGMLIVFGVAVGGLILHRRRLNRTKPITN
jgi:hypothetical protein